MHILLLLASYATAAVCQVTSHGAMMYTHNSIWLILISRALAEGEDWKLEDVRVNDSSKAASLASPRSDVSSEAESAKWTLVSRLTSQLAEGQTPAPPSSSGRSTPSNLERAVLLLESEKDHDRSQAAAGASAPDQTVSDKVAASAAVPDRGDGNGPDAVNLATRQVSLRKVTTSGGNGDGDSVEEGPSTPPTGGGPTRSGSLKADTPSSAAGVVPLLTYTTNFCTSVDASGLQNLTDCRSARACR